ncbi:MAG: hypothetical protein V1793_12255 [Pseudomonadota bacterium]
MSRKSINRDVFDFELGYITKSPCLTCKDRKNSPECYETCALLDRIRTLLARGISTQASALRA